MNSEQKGENKTVLISGAGGGLGKALVKIFAGQGFRVIAADISENQLKEIILTDNVSGVIMDVTNPDQINRMVKEYRLEQEGLDILVCAAGIYDTYPLTEAPPDLFKGMMEVNLLGTVNLVQGLLGALMKKQGRVMVVSSESYKIMALFQPYMISKSSLEAYCRVARQELALKGMSLSVIRPGAINTPLLNWMNISEAFDKYPVYKEELKKSLKRSIKMVGKISSPAMVANKILQAATASNPKRVYRVNNNPLLHLVSLIPVSFLDRIIIRLFR